MYSSNGDKPDPLNFDESGEEGGGHESASAGAHFEQPAPKPKARRPFATWLMIALAVGLFGTAWAYGEPVFAPKLSTIVKWGGNYGPRTMKSEYWRLVSSMFVNFGAVYFGLLNLIVFWSMGSVEKLLGSVRFLIIALLSGAGGAITSICFHPTQVSYGIAGPCFGLVGAILPFFFYNRRWFGSGALRGTLQGVAQAIFVSILLNMLISGNIAGMLGATATGFLAGIALAPGNVRNPRWGLRESCGLVLLLGVLGIGGYEGWKFSSTPASRQAAQLASMDEITVGSMTIEYAPEIPKATAERLGDVLSKEGWAKNPWTILVTNDGGKPAVGFVVKDGAWLKEGIVPEFQELGSTISIHVFSRQPIEIRLYDAHQEVKKTLDIKVEPSRDVF